MRLTVHLSLSWTQCISFLLQLGRNKPCIIFCSIIQIAEGFNFAQFINRKSTNMNILFRKKEACQQTAVITLKLLKLDQEMGCKMKRHVLQISICKKKSIR